MRNNLILILFLILSAFLPSCEKEYFNPSAAGEVQVVSSVDGLTALANGLQFTYSVGRLSPVYNTITASGFTTGELAILNAGNASENFLSLGGTFVDGGNSIVSALWEQNHLVKANAEILLKNAANFGDPAFQSAAIAYGSIFKALSLGNLATYFQQAPIQVTAKASFQTREALLTEAITTLNTAKSKVQATAPSSSFLNKTVGGLDILNTINALIARYSLMNGKWDDALTAANAVNLKAKSVFRYDDIARNPIFDVALSNVNVFQPISANLGLKGDLIPSQDDKRVLFYLRSKTPSATGIFSGTGFFTANKTEIPVFIPGEIMLIKAEALARKNQLSDAKVELDKVLTKKASEDIFAIGADLPAYSGALTQEALLKEIYRNRCIELYMSGLKLEDSRRFLRPGPGASGAERTRNFYPYPNNERDNNPNTPADPAI
ncbi:MAG: RagB/SusD family nutrient uptake outer membrane protein [Bacteroidetes bacterium]|nr:RagB/SusD family nutrient uptake outer membrane protein [Bacteroidota bacterium]